MLTWLENRLKHRFTRDKNSVYKRNKLKDR